MNTGSFQLPQELVPNDRIDLHDCTKCQGLCCVLTHIDTSRGEFPQEKPAGVSCPNLQLPIVDVATADYRCKIHGTLLQCGWQGCITYTCYGAGQMLTDFLNSMNIELANHVREGASSDPPHLIGTLCTVYNLITKVVYEPLHTMHHRSDRRVGITQDGFRNVLIRLFEDLRENLLKPDYKFREDYWTREFTLARTLSPRAMISGDPLDQLWAGEP